MARKIAGLLLAAGGSYRLNSPKQLVKISGNYLINHMIQIIRDGRISDIFVVLGAFDEKIKSKINDRDVVIIHNKEWEEGIHTSIKSGIKEILNKQLYKAVIIFVVDQPFLTSEIIKKQIQEFDRISPKVIAVRVNGEQVNPVLFARDTFEELVHLKKGQSGKNVIQNYPVHWVDSDNQLLQIDIDTQDDYRKVLVQLTSSGSLEK